MKITDITMTIPLYVETVQGRGDARSSFSGPRANTFVQVQTDEGITGICPAIPTPDINAFVLDVFKPLVVGEDPFEVEKIWEKLYWTNYGSSRSARAIIPACLLRVER